MFWFAVFKYHAAGLRRSLLLSQADPRERWSSSHPPLARRAAAQWGVRTLPRDPRERQCLGGKTLWAVRTRTLRLGICERAQDRWLAFRIPAQTRTVIVSKDAVHVYLIPVLSAFVSDSTRHLRGSYSKVSRTERVRIQKAEHESTRHRVCRVWQEKGSHGNARDEIPIHVKRASRRSPVWTVDGVRVHHIVLFVLVRESRNWIHWHNHL